MIVATKTYIFPDPNQMIFVRKSNQKELSVLIYRRFCRNVVSQDLFWVRVASTEGITRGEVFSAVGWTVLASVLHTRS